MSTIHSVDELKATLQEWKDKETALREMDQTYLVIKKEKKVLQEAITEFMGEKGIKRIAVGPFELSHTSSQRIPPLNAKTISAAMNNSRDADILNQRIADYRAGNKVTVSRLKVTRK